MGFFDKTNKLLYQNKNIRKKFGGINAMKNFLGIDVTPPTLKRCFKVASKLRLELTTDYLTFIFS